ncbi:hypothetical protein M9Y10_011224 [Tritrichomonas musculus]|uniref:Uncharacterized protein n=1 Tax=Tritrichomonas musculus TaxID=1915356 RepID=A0ABR2IIX9_9EUKA
MDKNESFIHAETYFYHELFGNDLPDFLIQEVLNSEMKKNVDEKSAMANSFNKLCDLNINGSPIQYDEGNLLVDKNVDSMRIGRRNLDLHGYTEKGSMQATRRLLLLLDKTHPNVVKFNVGIGSHSDISKVQTSSNSETSDEGIPNHVTRKAVRQVCIEDLNLPEPQQHPINKGYLIERLPTSVFNEAS